MRKGASRENGSEQRRIYRFLKISLSNSKFSSRDGQAQLSVCSYERSPRAKGRFIQKRSPTRNGGDLRSSPSATTQPFRLCQGRLFCLGLVAAIGLRYPSVLSVVRTQNLSLLSAPHRRLQLSWSGREKTLDDQFLSTGSVLWQKRLFFWQFLPVSVAWRRSPCSNACVPSNAVRTEMVDQRKTGCFRSHERTLGVGLRLEWRKTRVRCTGGLGV